MLDRYIKLTRALRLRPRARTLRSIVRAVFMTATTTVHRSFSADAHRRSGAMVKVGHPAAHH